jgi:hypothetical protein
LRFSVVVLVAAGAVGHNGGEIVYRHGAAAAYLQPAPNGSGSPLAYMERGDDHDDDD